LPVARTIPSACLNILHGWAMPKAVPENLAALVWTGCLRQQGSTFCSRSACSDPQLLSFRPSPAAPVLPSGRAECQPLSCGSASRATTHSSGRGSTEPSSQLSLGTWQTSTATSTQVGWLFIEAATACHCSPFHAEPNPKHTSVRVYHQRRLNR
jgi:hypothetical protein